MMLRILITFLVLVSVLWGCFSQSVSHSYSISPNEIKIADFGDQKVRIAVPATVSRIIYCRQTNLEGCKAGKGEFFTSTTYQEVNGRRFFISNLNFNPEIDQSLSIVPVGSNGEILGERRVQFFK